MVQKQKDGAFHNFRAKSYPDWIDQHFRPKYLASGKMNIFLGKKFVVKIILCGKIEQVLE